jgi:hypothetical protein
MPKMNANDAMLRMGIALTEKRVESEVLCAVPFEHKVNVVVRNGKQGSNRYTVVTFYDGTPASASGTLTGWVDIAFYLEGEGCKNVNEVVWKREPNERAFRRMASVLTTIQAFEEMQGR